MMLPGARVLIFEYAYTLSILFQNAPVPMWLQRQLCGRALGQPEQHQTTLITGYRTRAADLGGTAALLDTLGKALQRCRYNPDAAEQPVVGTHLLQRSLALEQRGSNLFSDVGKLGPDTRVAKLTPHLVHAGPRAACRGAGKQPEPACTQPGFSQRQRFNLLILQFHQPTAAHRRRIDHAAAPMLQALTITHLLNQLFQRIKMTEKFEQSRYQSRR